MTLFESIKAKIKDGWTRDRLESHYNWIIPSHLHRIVKEAQRDLKIEARHKSLGLPITHPSQ